MDTSVLWQLHREGRDAELMQWAQGVDPLTVPDVPLRELLGELFAGADQVGLAILWYCRANTSAAWQALPLLFLRQGDINNARMLLATHRESCAEWDEANYLLRLTENPTPAQRLDALDALLQEQCMEPYMTEYAALCVLAGQEKKGLHMAKKQLRLFPGGPYEQQAQEILNGGAAAAQMFLAQLEARRRPQAWQAAAPVMPAVPAAPPPEAVSANPPLDAAAKKPDAPERPLPEAVGRCFEAVVGMAQARKVLLQLHDGVQLQRSRRDYQLDVREHFHFLLRGAGGSGKTLLAGRISSFLYELGAAGDPAPCVLESYQLNDYLAGAGNELVDALAQCSGRTVIVDGIAPLFDAAGSGSRWVELLRKILEQFQESLNFILMGSSGDMDRLLAQEPTLAGMFLYDIKLEPYTPGELVEMARLIAAGKGYALTDEAGWQLERRLEAERRTSTFRNGKTLEAIIDQAAVRLAQRLAQMDTVSKGRLMRIEAGDIEMQEGARSLEELMDELNSLTGLAAVKKQVRELAAQAKVNHAAIQAGEKGAGFGTLHMIFTGNAGTGKTTVARIIGGIYRALGILPQGDKLVECKRADLVAPFVGQTAPMVAAKVAEALGGVLFIDEAYALCDDDRASFGKEAIDTLVAEVENHRSELMVILAGYPKEMDRFVEQNQGLTSRFPNRIDFEDYTQEEMEEIFLGMLAAERGGMRLAAGCEELLRQYIAENRGKKDFGNARGIRNLQQRLIKAQSLRLSGELEKRGSLPPGSFRTILPEDFDGLIGSGARKESLQDLLDELNGLIGLASVKNQVRQKISAILGKKEIAERNLGGSMDFGTLHMAFKGNAGTGKTTAARIIGRIYNALGLLPSGDIFVECTCRDLVGEYQGHTAMKARRVVDSALGGVLFIDEAYGLCRDAQDSFGREALETLIADMENHRKELMVILAGYSEEMDRFLEQNQGMPSRVPTTLTFEDYTQGELFQIFQSMLAGKGLVLSAGAQEPARRLIAERSQASDFGNARGVRNLAEKVEEFHHARMGDIIYGGGRPTDEELVTIVPEDIQGI